MDRGEWTLRSLRVATPTGLRPADVAVRGERVVAVRAHDDPETEGVILDAGDCVVLPGLVDIRADFHSHPDARGLEIRTRLAAAGGVTAMIDPPVDFGPGPIGARSFSARLTLIAASIWVDCGFSVPLLPASSDRISPLVDCGVFAFKARFGDLAPGSLPPATEADLKAAMPAMARAGRPLVVSVGEEAGPIRILIDLCRRHGCPIHIARVGSADALGWLVVARDEGLPLTAGALASDFLPGDDPPAALDPLWEGLRSGLIGAIAPDGPPWGDSTGQPALPGIWAEALRRGFSPGDVARWMSGGPADWLGLAGKKGSIAPGFDADFVVFDPATTSVEVEATVVRGSIVQFSGRFDGRPRGGVLLRLEETWPASGGLDRLNSLDQDQAVAAFLRCRGPARWAEDLASLRPFGSRADLIEAADRAWATLGPDDLLEAFAASSCLDDAGDSTQTQSSLGEIARTYARKFGFPLVFHRTGRLGPDDVAILRRRLANAPEAEFRLAAEEASRIARLALGQLFL